jgi:hypothetical protein
VFALPVLLVAFAKGSTFNDARLYRRYIRPCALKVVRGYSVSVGGLREAISRMKKTEDVDRFDPELAGDVPLAAMSWLFQANVRRSAP